MRLLIVAVGQRVPDWAQTAYDDYAKRFPPELKVELKAVKTETRGSKSVEALMAAERERIEAAIPRGARVVALEKPTEVERGQWYFQRYIQNLPTSGEIVFFDRSWYNRAGVERVMGFCSPTEYLEFLRQTPELERMLVNSGLHLFKYWFSVSREEQLRRFISRRDDPLKHWKLSPIDIQSLDKWDEYTMAKKAMFFHTDTAAAPWTVIKSDDKKRARLNCIRHFLSVLDYPDKDHHVVGHGADPLLVGNATSMLEAEETRIDAFCRGRGPESQKRAGHMSGPYVFRAGEAVIARGMQPGCAPAAWRRTGLGRPR